MDKPFAIAGANDTDAQCTNCAVAILTTPGFKSKDHPRECLNFWYNIKVGTISALFYVSQYLK